MNKENEKLKFKAYTREKDSQSKALNQRNNPSSYGKQFTFDKYKINFNKLKRNKRNNSNKNNIKGTVNYSHQLPLQKAYPIKENQHNQLLTEFPLIKRKSQTPTPLTKLNHQTKNLHTSPNKPLSINKKSNKPLGNFVKVKYHSTNNNSHNNNNNISNSPSNVKYNFDSFDHPAKLNQYNNNKKENTPSCNSPITEKEFKINSNSNININFKKPHSPLFRVSTQKVKDTNYSSKLKGIVNLKTKILHLTQEIDKLKDEQKQNMQIKDEEIVELTKKLNEQQAKNDNSINEQDKDKDNSIITHQKNKINKLESKLKETQDELFEFKKLSLKQKKLIEELTTQLRVQEDINKQITQSSMQSFYDQEQDKNKEKLIYSNTPKATSYTQEQINETSLLLRKIFDVKEIPMEIVVYNLFENDIAISIDRVVEKLMSLINNTYEQNRSELMIYFESLANESNPQFVDMELIKNKFIEHMANLKLIYSKELKQKMNDDLVSILSPYQEMLENKFKKKDDYNKGIISIDKLKAILSELSLKLSIENYEQLIYIMKQFDDCNYDIHDLNYFNLNSLLQSTNPNEVDEENVNGSHNSKKEKEKEVDYNGRAKNMIDEIFKEVLSCKNTYL